MSTDRVLDIIENLQEKLKNHKPFHMNTNGVGGGFQIFPNRNINNRPFEEFINHNDNNMNNDFIENNQNYLQENQIRKLIREEFSELILDYQSDMLNRFGVLDLKVNNLNNKMSDIKNLNQGGFLKIDNINKNIDYDNKLSEMEYKLSEFESFFKSWKEVLKKNETNLTSSIQKNNNEQELKLMQLESKINNELNKFYTILNDDVNKIKKTLEQINNNEIEINNLEGKLNKMQVDFNYVNKDIKVLNDLFNSQIKKELNGLMQKNNDFTNEINLLKSEFDNIKKNNIGFKEDLNKVKNDINNINNHPIIKFKDNLKISRINDVEEIFQDDENNRDNNIDNNNNRNNNHNNNEY